MSDIQSEAESLRSRAIGEIEPPIANGLDKSAAQADLAANAEERMTLRREVDKAEFRTALRDLSEGLRGVIRVAPFAAVLSGVAIGLMLGRRRSAPRRPALPIRR